MKLSTSPIEWISTKVKKSGVVSGSPIQEQGETDRRDGEVVGHRGRDVRVGSHVYVDGSWRRYPDNDQVGDGNFRLYHRSNHSTKNITIKTQEKKEKFY